MRCKINKNIDWLVLSLFKFCLNKVKHKTVYRLFRKNDKLKKAYEMKSQKWLQAIMNYPSFCGSMWMPT